MHDLDPMPFAPGEGATAPPLLPGGSFEDCFRALFDASPEPMWVFDVETLRFLEVNKAACARYGYAREQFLALTIAAIRPEEDIGPLLASVARVRGDFDRVGIWRHHTRAGELLDVEITTHRVTFGGRSAKLVLAHDITARLAAERAAAAALARVQQTLRATVDAVSRMSELRDPYTAGHERRVAAIAVAIGRRMGLDEDRLEGLSIAGYLHDLGKVTVPVEILTKPGRLTALEMEIVRTHPDQGYEVLRGIDFPWPVANVVRQHHERVDGSGYPLGLRGDAILLEARILGVADVVESMASDRPYRPGLGVAAALAEIERHAGRLYDAHVARVCLELYRDEGLPLPR